MPELEDLVSLDRDVAEAWRRVSRWRRGLAVDPERAAEEDPFVGVRHVAGRSTYEALGQTEPSAGDLPHRDALRRWVYALTLARIEGPVDVAWARAAAAEVARFEGERPRLVSWREAWRNVLSARARGEAELWLRAAAERGPELAPIAAERRARHVEAARRLGLEDPDAPLVSAAPGALREQARALLDATEDLATAMRREGAPDPRPSPVDVWRLALARDAGEGWPARLTARWLEERFGELARGLSLDLPPLPAPLGAASFARAMFSFGVALRIAASPRSLPFALAHEPWPVSAYRWGFVVAALSAEPIFHMSGLGLVRRVAERQARALAKSALFEARLHAARLLMVDVSEPSVVRDRFEELGTRLTGAPLPASLAGAWPRPREDEPARWLALLTALPMARELVERFDVDWFRNPRTGPHLRELAAVPAREPEVTLTDHAHALARAFERALG